MQWLSFLDGYCRSITITEPNNQQLPLSNSFDYRCSGIRNLFIDQYQEWKPIRLKKWRMINSEQLTLTELGGYRRNLTNIHSDCDVDCRKRHGDSYARKHENQALYPWSEVLKRRNGLPSPEFIFTTLWDRQGLIRHVSLITTWK